MVGCWGRNHLQARLKDSSTGFSTIRSSSTDSPFNTRISEKIEEFNDHNLNPRGAICGYSALKLV